MDSTLYTDLYGFERGELVQLVNQPTLFGCILHRTSAEGRLLVRCLVHGRYQEFAVLPSCLKSLTKAEATP